MTFKINVFSVAVSRNGESIGRRLHLDLDGSGRGPRRLQRQQAQLQMESRLFPTIPSAEFPSKAGQPPIFNVSITLQHIKDEREVRKKGIGEKGKRDKEKGIGDREKGMMGIE